MPLLAEVPVPPSKWMDIEMSQMCNQYLLLPNEWMTQPILNIFV